MRKTILFTVVVTALIALMVVHKTDAAIGDVWCAGGASNGWCFTSGGDLIPNSASLQNIGAASLPIGVMYTKDLSASGTFAIVSTSGVAVSSSATSAATLRFRGATVTLSTRAITYGDVFLQTSDNKVYIATRTVGEGDGTCAGTVCYSAFN